jgi:MFS family permease
MEEENAAIGYNEAAEDAKQKEAESKERTQSATPQSASGPADKRKMISLFLILGSIFLWFFGYTAVTAMASRYTFDVWGTNQGTMMMIVAQAIALLAAVPTAMLSAKIGRKWTIMIGIGILALGYGLLIPWTGFNASMYIFFGLIGFGWLMININSFPMVVELAKGKNVGKYTGFYYIASMSGQLLTKLLIGVLFDTAGDWILFPYALVFTLLAALTMFFVKHGDTHGKKITLGKKGDRDRGQGAGDGADPLAGLERIEETDGKANEELENAVRDTAEN